MKIAQFLALQKEAKKKKKGKGNPWTGCHDPLNKNKDSKKCKPCVKKVKNKQKKASDKKEIVNADQKKDLLALSKKTKNAASPQVEEQIDQDANRMIDIRNRQKRLKEHVRNLIGPEHEFRSQFGLGPISKRKGVSRIEQTDADRPSNNFSPEEIKEKEQRKDQELDQKWQRELHKNLGISPKKT